MTLSTHWRTARWIVLGLAALIALLAWMSASAQPEPPFQVYGDGEPGDVIAVYDESGNEQGKATVGAAGTWFVRLESTSADTVHLLTFTINDEPATAEVTSSSSTLAEITLTPATADENGMTPESDDEMMEENGDMMEEDDMMEDESMEEDQQEDAYPDSGSGGLAGNGPSTTALIGTLLVLAVLITGAGVWTLRRRS